MKYLLPILLLVFLTSCSSDDDKSLELTADFESINNDLFSKTCATSGCHSGESPIAGLDLSLNASYLSLLGPNLTGAVGEASGQVLVVPDEPDSSYLITKLESDDPDVRMPKGGSAISQKNIDAIRLWISNGAFETKAEELE